MSLNPLKRVNSILTIKPRPWWRGLVVWVSIPSNGSIQFLHGNWLCVIGNETHSGLNPLKRVNSILTSTSVVLIQRCQNQSQSPQTGQFNSYGIGHAFNQANILAVSIPSNGSIQFLLERATEKITEQLVEVSIPSNGSIQFLPFPAFVAMTSGGSLNPLKRVNSILTIWRWVVYSF